MSNSNEFHANPLPRLFAAALAMLLVAVIIAISQFGRFSPPSTTTTDTQTAPQTNAVTEQIRQRSSVLIVSVAVMTGLVVLGGLAVTLLLNRYVDKRYSRAALWNTPVQQTVPVIDRRTLRRVQQANRVTGYGSSIPHNRHHG